MNEEIKKRPTKKQKNQTGILLTIVTLAYMGQMLLNPILAPLARAIGLAEWHVGAIISTAAVFVTLLSQFWGRYSQKVGPKKVLTFTMVLGFIALGSFALVVFAGERGFLAGFWLVVGAILTRGALYGTAISAVVPTVQSYLVAQSETENERVKVVGSVGATTGIAGILGSVLGGVLAMIGGLMLPLSVMPFMMLIAAAVLAFVFKPKDTHMVIESPRKVSYFDKRAFPFLIVGFILFLTFSALQTVIGFAVQDRLGVDASATAGYTAVLMVAMSITMIFSQVVLVAKLNWSSRRLLKIGFVMVVACTIAFLLAQSFAVMILAAILAGLGMGLSMPGYNAGPTMYMDPEEQGGLAGLISANNGATYIVAPVLSTALYSLNPVAPFVLMVCLAIFGLIFCNMNPLLRREKSREALANEA